MTPTPSVTSAVLPETLPILPLSGVVLLPRGHLPLNIFEPRYLALVEDALGQGRLIGLVQPSAIGPIPPLYKVGCAGRITSFSETEDGRFLLNVLGVCRFRVDKELPEKRGYRRVTSLWDDFLADMGPAENPDFDRTRLLAILRRFMQTQGLTADWDSVQAATGDELISMLCMATPLQANEKQALLEAPSLQKRAEMLMTLLEMSFLQQNPEDGARH